MFGDGALTFQEFKLRETLRLATLQDAVLEFLRGRNDAALFGAQAVNAYVDVPRMTEDVDIVSTRAAELAAELRRRLASRFHIALRIISEVGERGYRLCQIRKPKNRYLADLRGVPELPPARRVEGVLVVAPEELVAGKVVAFHARRSRPKSGSDWRDLAMLLLTFPELKRTSGPVADRLERRGAGPDVIRTWQEIVAQNILPENESGEFS